MLPDRVWVGENEWAGNGLTVSARPSTGGSGQEYVRASVTTGTHTCETCGRSGATPPEVNQWGQHPHLHGGLCNGSILFEPDPASRASRDTEGGR